MKISLEEFNERIQDQHEDSNRTLFDQLTDYDNLVDELFETGSCTVKVQDKDYIVSLNIEEV